MSEPNIKELEQEAEAAQKALRDARFAVINAKMALKRKCHWCGKNDDDNEDDGYGPLIDFTLVTSEGEEGYARVERFCCQEHYEWLHTKFDEIGFTIHAHGGICFLEASCVPNSYTNCPTPEEQFPDE